GGAGIAEHELHALLLEELEKRFLSGHHRHGQPPYLRAQSCTLAAEAKAASCTAFRNRILGRAADFHQWRRPCLRLHASGLHADWARPAIFDPMSWGQSWTKSSSPIQSKLAASGLALADSISHAIETLAGSCLGHPTL